MNEGILNEKKEEREKLKWIFWENSETITLTLLFLSFSFPRKGEKTKSKSINNCIKQEILSRERKEGKRG